MSDTSGRMRLIAILGTVSGLAAFFWVVSLIDSSGSPVADARSLELFLALPVLVILALAGAAWFIVSRSTAHRAEPRVYVECDSCSRSILEEWRLCPYCGSRVDRDAVPEATAHPTA
jgi:hypothetical protein